MSERLRIIVAGYIVRFPLGGMTWHYLQYVLGLHQMGHEVYMIEDSDDYPNGCYDPRADAMSPDPAAGLAYTGAVFDRVGLGDRWAYYDVHTDRWHGPAGDDGPRLCSEADIFINVSGTAPVREWMGSVPIRVFIDTDPAFEQVRQITVPDRRSRGDDHTNFFSFGELIGRDRSRIPDDGRPWAPTRQPVVLNQWDPDRGPTRPVYTTVMAWDSYAVRELHGVRYGMKSASFDEYFDLPASVDVGLELAIGSPTAPKERLRAAGWQVRDPRGATWDPWMYQEYISASRAEFSVAKHGYVTSRSGWFSERSACYLASGRPVITQDTGFSDVIATGNGLLAFDSLESAREAIESVERDYKSHRVAARRLAEESFASTKVLGSLLHRVI